VAGDTVELLLGGGSFATPVVHTNPEAERTKPSVSLTAGALGSYGKKTISAKFSDAAGNSSTTGSLSITLDTTAPTGGTPDLTDASDSAGPGGSNLVIRTHLGTPLFPYTTLFRSVAGDTVELLLGGGSFATPVVH